MNLILCSRQLVGLVALAVRCSLLNLRLKDLLFQLQSRLDGDVRLLRRGEFLLKVADARLDFVIGLDADLFELDGQRELLLNGITALKPLKCLLVDWLFFLPLRLRLHAAECGAGFVRQLSAAEVQVRSRLCPLVSNPGDCVS